MPHADNPLTPKGRASRLRLIDAGIDRMRTSGLSGAGINEVVKASGAPKGSVYHFFPGGKAQLVNEALAVYAERVEAFIGAAMASARTPEGRVRDQLKRGERIRAILRQPQHAPFRLIDEIALMRAVQAGLLQGLAKGFAFRLATGPTCLLRACRCGRTPARDRASLRARRRSAIRPRRRKHPVSPVYDGLPCPPPVPLLRSAPSLAGRAPRPRAGSR